MRSGESRNPEPPRATVFQADRIYGLPLYLRTVRTQRISNHVARAAQPHANPSSQSHTHDPPQTAMHHSPNTEHAIERFNTPTRPSRKPQKLQPIPRTAHTADPSQIGSQNCVLSNQTNLSASGSLHSLPLSSPSLPPSLSLFLSLVFLSSSPREYPASLAHAGLFPLHRLVAYSALYRLRVWRQFILSTHVRVSHGMTAVGRRRRPSLISNSPVLRLTPSGAHPSGRTCGSSRAIDQ